MQFIKTEDIKRGMRLARPIYSKKGVLLYDRDSEISAQAIESIRNFGLLGIYILEPAEPLPPMSEEDLEYERFQTMMVASIEEEITKMMATGSQYRIQAIADMIIKKYGHLDRKIHFYQNLRSREDYVYRHCLNVAILCAMMSHVMNMKREEQLHTICAALVHDIAKIDDKSESVYDDIGDEDELRRLYQAQMQSLKLVEKAFAADGANIRRICTQAGKAQRVLYGEDEARNLKLLTGAKILMVANRYDEITAMNLTGTAQSEVKALREFVENPEVYDPGVVAALIQSVKILFSGVSIELSTGEKAMVLAENPDNVLRPMVLSFKDNSILDLSAEEYEDIYVEDIMKTLDNRYVMEEETLRNTVY